MAGKLFVLSEFPAGLWAFSLYPQKVIRSGSSLQSKAAESSEGLNKTVLTIKSCNFLNDRLGFICPPHRFYKDVPAFAE